MTIKFLRTFKRLFYIACSCILFSFTCSAEQSASLSKPQNTRVIHFTKSRSIVSYGSDTLANLMFFWAKEFQNNYPKINFELHSEGSTTAIKMLLSNQADLGPMSRLMTSQELDVFEKKFGYQPIPVKVAMDALVMYVNRENPLIGISLAQIDSVFSTTRKCGLQHSIDSWQQLGLTGTWKEHPIELIGRNQVSGTYGFFKQKALCKGDFKPRVSLQPGSTSLIQVVSHAKYALGFSGLGFKTSGVKPLSLLTENGKRISATSENVQKQIYPLSRFLYIYINWPKSNPLPSKIHNFITYVLSGKGQKIVEQDGYISLSESTRKEQLNMLGLSPRK